MINDSFSIIDGKANVPNEYTPRWSGRVTSIDEQFYKLRRRKERVG